MRLMIQMRIFFLISTKRVLLGDEFKNKLFLIYFVLFYFVSYFTVLRSHFVPLKCHFGIL